MSSLVFSMGVFDFLMDALFSLGSFSLGGALMALGGAFLLMGLRKNYLFWSSQDHFA